MRICYGTRLAVHRVEQAIFIGRLGEPDDMPTRCCTLLPTRRSMLPALTIGSVIQFMSRTTGAEPGRANLSAVYLRGCCGY
jgi:hypothetical protein